ncbi:GH36-type glycosyl hydrolase domain-containing protein [Methylocella sp.]|uniref:GH36-type glycosyl hydrolase domain-containing protein n=1 Tax=Methylocella sp. TaxID=1978226 RepID=UPI003C1C0E17
MGLKARNWTTPRDDSLGLSRIENGGGLSISALPNGCIFSIEHRHEGGAILINQLLGSPIDGSVQRIYLRIEGDAPIEIVGPGADIQFGASPDCFIWAGETQGVSHRVALFLEPNRPAWIWRVELENHGRGRAMDAVLVQDIGLGGRGFLMNNEAYVSQYIDHFVASHARFGPVVMNRQNLAQDGRHPFAMHGCLDGAVGYATDGKQLFGPAFRDDGAFRFPFGEALPSARLQHEMACVAIQSAPRTLAPGGRAAWRFFGLYDADHPTASSAADLPRVDALPQRDSSPSAIALAAPAHSPVQSARAVEAAPLTEAEIARLYPERAHEERADGVLLSFFAPDAPHNRHVVLRDKERIATRRHGAILRSSDAMLPDEATLCATAWMHGIFAAQLTIGNTSFHKLFSVSRDPYNVTRASGLRILIDLGEGWRLLAIPSAFEIGLSDCRWIYSLKGRLVTISAIASGDDPAMQWRIAVEGEACRFLIFGHLTLGERELDHASRIEVDAERKSFSFRPDPDWLWGQRYPHAIYHLVSSTPDAIEAIGGDELLYADGIFRGGAYAAIRTAPTRDYRFAVVGSMTSAGAANELAAKFERAVTDEELLAPARRFWRTVTRGLRIDGAPALDALFPWLAQNAMIHLTVPHGLEQYTGAAWGTRDVCQGPVEFLLALRHDEPVKEILRLIFAQQYESSGDWPQWFMLDPYAIIQDRVSHGDVIVWPLKALNDYIEATGDFAFLDEPTAWRADNLERTTRKDSVAAHIDKLVSAVRARFIPGMHLIRYGEGDWNDSLQPVDPLMRDLMVSSWTVALLFQQLQRAAEIFRRSGRPREGRELRELADAMRADFNADLIRDGAVAGYAIFAPGAAEPELLLHPSDVRTGLSYSLLPMTRAILSGLFTPEQTRHHLKLIRENLLFPDGARLMDLPVAYRGGPQRIFRRAESAAFFGREIGLMYVHAHLRYAEAMAVLGDLDALFDALDIVNPVSIGERLPTALPRQRNAFFSSSDAAFPNRASASAEWDRVRAGAIGFEGGWRIYSSGPGLFTNLLIRHGFGERRLWGEPAPCVALAGVTMSWDLDEEA